MGYYTNYRLSVKDEDKLRKSGDSHYEKFVLEMEKEDEEDRFLYSFWTGDADSCKWYEHEEDMKEFSKKFPDLVFELKGEGEESGDLWIKYFKNGKMQVCRSNITFDEYEEDKLK